MNINPNQLDRGYQKYKTEYDKAAIETLESGWYIMGSRLDKFEKEFADFTETRYCVGLNSGTDALILAIRALEIGPGDEVIVPANTYIATVLAITENGAKPVFVEPDAYYNIDVEKIEEKITNHTKAIMVVHLYGQAANMSKVKEIANKHNLYIVEDSAQSHGAEFDGKMVWGDIACFSYYPTKNIGAFGDAGSIVTDNKELFERVKLLRNYGSKEKYQNEIIGVNSRLDEIQAALLSVKLKHYDELKEGRAVIAKQYLSGIKNDRLILPPIQKRASHVWHLFVVRTNQRFKLQKYLEENGIGTQVHYPVPPHLSKAYAYLGYGVGDFPITEEYADTVLSLPLYDGMTEDEVNYVIETINKYEG